MLFISAPYNLLLQHFHKFEAKQVLNEFLLGKFRRTAPATGGEAAPTSASVGRFSPAGAPLPAPGRSETSQVRAARKSLIKGSPLPSRPRRCTRTGAPCRPESWPITAASLPGPCMIIGFDPIRILFVGGVEILRNAGSSPGNSTRGI